MFVSHDKISARPVVHLFFNPLSGKHSPRRLRALMAALKRSGAAVISTISDDKLSDVAAHATHVCIAAGDGTVRHVAAMLARSGRDLPVAVYPAGTVNLLAMEFGYPADPVRFAERLLDGGIATPHHPITCGDHMIFACASAGPDSQVVARVSLGLKRRIGRLAYVAAFCTMLWEWRRPAITLTTDSGRFACEAFYVAKSRYFAGRWSFAPHARVSDLPLYVVALPQARRRDFFRFVWAMLCGQDPVGKAGIFGFSCTALTAESRDAVPFQADGDIVAMLPVTLAIHELPITFR